jgi:hypothetical protein
MTQAHIDFCIARLSDGAAEKQDLATYDIDAAEVLALDAAFEFDAEGSYDAVSDIPAEAPRPLQNVWVNGTRAYIFGDNGLCAFMFRLSRKQVAATP